MARLQLLPAPRSVDMTGGTFRLPPDVYIVLDPHATTRDIFAAERFVIEAESLTATRFHITMGTASVHSEQEIRACVDDAAGNGHEQGYRLSITREGIEIAAPTAVGTFYAFQTLLQILRQTAFAEPKGTARKKSQASRVALRDD